MSCDHGYVGQCAECDEEFKYAAVASVTERLERIAKALEQIAYNTREQ
jgi:hypothetical protein